MAVIGMQDSAPLKTILGADAISEIRSKLTEWFTTNTDIPDAFLSEVVEEYMVYVEGGRGRSLFSFWGYRI